MTPNQITVLRVLAGFGAVGLFQLSTFVPSARLYSNLAAVVLIIAAISLDALDGYVARRRNLATPLGAQFDILGDRIIENLFFTYFAVAGLISIWIPVIFFVRGSLTDFLRGLAARSGRSGFGKNSMLESPWARALVASRASRAAYGALKCVAFCYLGIQLTLTGAHTLAGQPLALFQLGAHLLVFSTLAFCILRGVPVLWEGRRFLSSVRALPAGSTNPAGAR